MSAHDPSPSVRQEIVLCVLNLLPRPSMLTCPSRAVIRTWHGGDVAYDGNTRDVRIEIRMVEIRYVQRSLSVLFVSSCNYFVGSDQFLRNGP